MAVITPAQIQAAFALASEVYDAKITSGVATKQLHEATGLNRGSAQDFIVQFRAMLGGEVFKRSISAGGGQYFLQKILETRGSIAANNALASVWRHIAYYESLGQGHLNKLRAVASNFITALPEGISLEVNDAQFSAAVARSRTDSTQARDKRLKKANPIPQTQVVITRVFKRNPDVVAAVLDRAQGTCEICAMAAPFARSTDGSPYLEVHHRTQLAHGGQDTVANAIALCPNCHRQLHHG